MSSFHIEVKVEVKMSKTLSATYSIEVKILRRQTVLWK